LAAAAMTAAACGSSTSTLTDGGGDGGVADSGAPPACVMMPMNTHTDIINACTNAQQIDKHPVLPLLNADGTLPPIP
jgi:hypothetical protein